MCGIVYLAGAPLNIGGVRKTSNIILNGGREALGTCKSDQCAELNPLKDFAIQSFGM